jgi:hypothetical protein
MQLHSIRIVERLPAQRALVPADFPEMRPILGLFSNVVRSESDGKPVCAPLRCALAYGVRKEFLFVARERRHECLLHPVMVYIHAENVLNAEAVP